MDVPKKPTPMPVNASDVPVALKCFDRWVCWSWIWNGKKFDKPPLDVRSGRNASSTNADTWASFDDAFKAHQSGRFDGIGFTLGAAGSSGVHFSGLDVDKCIVDGEINSDAMYLASVVDSYTEISPSGNGIKIFLTGPLLGTGRKKDDNRGIEFYDGGRYFTVTGNKVKGFPDEVLERSQQFSDLRDMTFRERPVDFISALTDRELAISALEGLDPSRADGYDSWMQIGFALHSVADDLLFAWDQWSQKSAKYTAGICEKKWRSMKKGGINLATLIFYAKKDGWKPPDGKPASPAKKEETNGKHEKEALPDEEEEKPERFNSSESNGKSSSSLEDNDISMGNGLTDKDDAGPWKLRIEMSNPRRYWLRSPIWQNSLDLKRTNGYILLTKRQLSNWAALRVEAMDQTGCYVMPEKSRSPVWDGRKGPRLYRRLLHYAEKAAAAPDFDRILSAIEWVIDQARRGGIVTDDKRENAIGHRAVMVMEDGCIIFKLRALAATSKKESSGFLFEDLRDAANRYGENYWPESKGRRHRYYKITPEKLKEIDNELSRKGRLECV